jgi:spore coat polysaccharide biosynthesis protein SpsF
MCIAILITPCLKSTRLPLTALTRIHGRPLMAHLIDRIKLARRPGRIILCASKDQQDDPFETLARQEGIEFFRGNSDDSLEVLVAAARAFEVETLIHCRADNPFTDPEYMDHLVDFHIENTNDFTRTEGLPLGTFSCALSADALARACEIKSETHLENWEEYFTETGHFKWGTLRVKEPAVHWPELRLTGETSEDLERITHIFDQLGGTGKVFPLRDIVLLCRQHPEWTPVSASVGVAPAS